MRMYDIIAKKRDNKALEDAEIDYFIDGYTSGDIPDYQASALLMAIYFNGMNEEEISHMTLKMAHSGDVVDLSKIKGIKVDKHSTGGVGDKTTLIVGPIVASLGVKVAKMSGRGLGHTGGTIDKMESIPSMQTSISRDKFFEIVNKVGISVIGQSGNLVPADKKLYALRDVTATVNSIPLIASSIMSKKIAAGSDCILLDVKTGSGAFMETLDGSIELAKEMVKIGNNAGRETIAVITDMDCPLGNAIGNSLEIKEVCDVLKGVGPADITEVALTLAANMLYMAKKGDLKETFEMARRQIENKEAFNKLKEMVEAQGGDVSVLENTDRFEKAKTEKKVLAKTAGYIYKIDTQGIGIASVELGAGREKKGDEIDYTAGIIMNKTLGDPIKEGDVICTLYTNNESLCDKAEQTIRRSVEIKDERPKKNPLIRARISENETIKY